jgi:hypothetical protein
MNYIGWAFSFLLICICTACYEPRKGCLDPNAVNLDVNADIDTGCIYPSLVLEFAHLHDGIGLNFDSIYQNDLGQKYRIRDVAFYLSGFTLLKGTQTYGLKDTFHAFQLLAPTANDSTRITPISDIAFVRRSTITLPIGSFREIGIFDGMHLDFGLRNELVSVLPGSVPTGNALRPQPEMLYDSTARAHRFARIVLELDPTTSKTDTLWLRDVEFAVGGQKITHIGQLTQRAGYNFTIKIGVDYALWMRNTDLTKPKSAIASQIAGSVLSGFYFGQ